VLNSIAPELYGKFIVMHTIRPVRLRFASSELPSDPAGAHFFGGNKPKTPMALIIGPSRLFAARSEQLGTLAAHNSVPAIGSWPEFAGGGGLLSYGSDETEYYRLVVSTPEGFSKERNRLSCRFGNSAKVKLIINIRCACSLLLMALLRHAAMSDMSPLCGAKRT
jgi:hypothetical protein